MYRADRLLVRLYASLSMVSAKCDFRHFGNCVHGAKDSLIYL